MKYLRQTAGYEILDHKRDKETLKELHVTSLEEKLCTYRHNCSNTFTEWKAKGSLNNFYSIIHKEETTWTTTEETTDTKTGHPGLNS
jgi:hypothetical protein